MCASWRVRRTAHVGHLVTARAELAAVIAESHYLMQGGVSEWVDQRVVVAGDTQLAFDIQAAGYVKTPSREAILAVLSSDDVHVRYALDWVIDAEMAADAILALLAGETS